MTDLCYRIFLTKALQAVAKFAAGDPIVSIDLGDMTHGDGHASGLVSTRLADQFLIAEANEIPVFELPNLIAHRIVSGTEVHSFGESSAEIIVANTLKKQYLGADIQVLSHGLLELDGVKGVVDYAHHGASPGTRDWLYGNQLRLYVQSIMDEEMKRRRIPPRLILRGHYHQFVPETVRKVLDNGEIYTTTAIIAPSLCFPNLFARKVTRSKSSFSVGLVAVEMLGASVGEIKCFTRTFDLRRKDKLLQ